ncbi:lytic murein transglycosylase [bacterium]|nr:lytic murein transglycosylase [bacterium]
MRFEKVIIDDLSRIDYSSHVEGRYKLLLLENLGAADWDESDIAIVARLLIDSRAEFQPSLLRRNSTHEETAEQYAHQLASKQVDKCMEFWSVKREIIANGADRYGIPPEIVVSILKVESNFGKYIGKAAVFNVFWSLSVADHPDVVDEILIGQGDEREEQKRRLLRRARWGRSELMTLVDLMKEGTDEKLVWGKGSWAGAFGLPQFIPSSYRAYARDGDDDNILDLYEYDDAAASIAYYLKANGWKGQIDRERQKKVIMRYNQSSHYADCILALADSIQFRLKE